MAANLIDMFNSTVGDLVVRQTSGMLGESADSTATAMHSIVPALLAAIIQKSDTDADLRSLLDYMSTYKLDGHLLSSVTSLLSGGDETESLKSRGALTLKELLGDKLGGVVDRISGSSGLKTSSASTMLKIIAPLLMSTVNKYITEKSLDNTATKSLLAGQREFIETALPKEISEFIGYGSVKETASSGSSVSSVSMATPYEKTTLSKLLPWIVLLITSLGLFYLVEKGCGPDKNNVIEQEEMMQDSLK